MKVAVAPRLVLFSKSGYSASLRKMAAEREDIELVDVSAALS